jgi:hypothetical protein
MRNFFKPNKKLNHRDRRARRGKNGQMLKALDAREKAEGKEKERVFPKNWKITITRREPGGRREAEI